MGGVFISEEILVHNIHIVARTMIDGVLIKKKTKKQGVLISEGVLYEEVPLHPVSTSTV